MAEVVSVVVPTYNRAHTLARALASIAAQTRPADEVIVVDDGSTDDTAQVVARFPEARLVRLPANGGAGRARNAGVRAARGDYIAFLDSDDAWAPAKLATQLARMARAPAPDLLCTALDLHAPGGVTRRPATAPGPQGWTFAELRTYPFSTSTWMIRRATFGAHGGFDETLPNCEDLDLLARMAPQCVIEIAPDVLVDKHLQSDGLDLDAGRTARSFELIFARHAALWARTPLAAAATWRRLAAMHVQAGNMAAARAALWNAVRCAPGRVQSWGHVALSLLGLRGYRLAIQLLGRPQPG